MTDDEILNNLKSVIKNVIINYALELDDPKTLKLIENGVATCISPWLPSEFNHIEIHSYGNNSNLCVDVECICTGNLNAGRPTISFGYIEHGVLVNLNADDDLFEFTLDDLDTLTLDYNGSRELEL